VGVDGLTSIDLLALSFTFTTVFVVIYNHFQLAETRREEAKYRQRRLEIEERRLGLEEQRSVEHREMMERWEQNRKDDSERWERIFKESAERHEALLHTLTKELRPHYFGRRRRV